MIRVAIIGCGGRGARTYGTLMHDNFADRYTLAALCDINVPLLNHHGERLGVAPENRFSDEKTFFEKKRADLLIVATQDRDHARMVIRGLELGYDILVEKPLTTDRDECARMLAAQKKTSGKVIVCHVLRYQPAFRKVAELLKEGRIGTLMAIDHMEQVWYAHYCHSFVRGNWRNSEETSPMILAKCCHDLDILYYYAGAKCTGVSSIGELSYFNRDNAPEGCADRCIDCKYMDSCDFSAKRIYQDFWHMNHGDFVFTRIATYPNEMTDETITQMLRTSPYGRCVFGCDNNVVDHQQVLMRFENGVHVTLSMIGATADGGRIMRLHGTKGEIVLNEEQGFVLLKTFRDERITWNTDDLIKDMPGGHNGGDYGLVKDLHGMLTGEIPLQSSLEDTVESHLMGIAAEKSRLLGGAMIDPHA